MKSPLSTVKSKFGEKAKLVAEVEKLATDDLWVSRTNKDKGLAHVSNAKLLRLHATFTEVKSKFGTRAKLIDAICDLEKRSKDAGYKTRLEAYPVPRLYDMWRMSTRRAKVQAAKPAAPKADKKPAKKAPAKKAAKKAEAK
jgi:hypothetical protein